MPVCYYFLNLLWGYKGKNDAFLTCCHLLYKIRFSLIICSILKATIVTEFSSKGWNIGLATTCCKSYVLVSESTIVPAHSTVVLAATDYATPNTADNTDLVDKLVLHKNDQVRNNVCTLFLILLPYCLQRIINMTIIRPRYVISWNNVICNQHTVQCIDYMTLCYVIFTFLAHFSCMARVLTRHK